MAAGKNHSIRHTPGDVARYCDAINVSYAGEMGKYAVLSVLPDKIDRFLYEYYDTLHSSLGLPPILLDRSGISVHCIL